jgi:hypothetical protein
VSAYLGPVDTPQAWALTVTAADPWTMPAVIVHRGLGGGSQAVWSAAPADAGQRLTHRCTAAEVPALLDALATPGRVAVTADGACPVLPMPAAVVTAVTVSYRYEVDPPAAEVAIEVAAV